MKFGQLIEYNKRNIFLQKSCRKWGRETSSRPLFVFKKSFIRGKSKWSAASFWYNLIAFLLVYNKNKLWNFRLLIQRYVQFWFFRKGSGNSFSTTFWEWFLKKNGSHVITKFYCLIPFTSWDIGQDVYCNYLLTRLWRHKFLDWPDLFNQAVFIHNQRVKTKT